MGGRSYVAFARITALWVACVFGLAGLSAFVHRAVVEHEVCGEHGELVHVGEHAAEPGTPGAPRPGDEDEHEHCQLGQATDPAIGLDLAPAVAVAPASPLPRLAAPVRGPPIRSVLLRLAPKTSPPRA